jgi:hypothetical protein
MADGDIDALLTITLQLTYGSYGNVLRDGEVINSSFTIPLSMSATMDRWTKVDGGITIPFSSYGTVYTHPMYDLDASLTIPLIESDSSVLVEIFGTVDFDIPFIKLEMDGYDSCIGIADPLLLPELQITSTGYIDEIANAALSIPILIVDLAGLVDIDGIAELTIPRLRLNDRETVSSVAISEVGNASFTLPMQLLSGAVLNGAVGSASLSIPIQMLSATSLFSYDGNADLTIPLIRLSSLTQISQVINGIAVIDNTLALCLNPQNMALTTYSNYAYNSLCYFNGKNIAADSSGIYELTGTTDNHKEINWNFRTGYIDLQVDIPKKLLQAWFGYKGPGDLLVKIILPGGEEYEYNLKSYSDNESESRVKFGKGIDSRYVQLDVSSISGESIDLDMIKLQLNRPGAKR